MRVITRDIPDDYFTAKRFEVGHTVKYVCAVDRRQNEIMVIFGPNRLHKQVVEGFGFASAISAGYIEYEPEIGFYCFGEATSLMVRARRKEDTEILNNWIVESGVDKPEKTG